ncbi:MAG: hypothetical protein HQL90_10610 [Magnetococcales bacterium]|nr:hypothetical protein [Magnetococcales bacterium]
MKTARVFCLLGLMPLVSTPLLAAEGESGPRWAGLTFSGSLTLTTDYVSRGLTTSDKQPAVQGAVNANHVSGFYGSLWASNIDLNDGEGTAVEVDLTGGFAKAWENGFDLDLGLIQYLYPSSPSRLDYNYREYFIGGGYKLDKASLKIKHYYSDDASGVGDNSASYLDAQVAYELPRNFTLKGHFGHAYGDAIKALGTKSIDDYSIGVATEVAGFGAELTLVGMDKDGRIANPVTHANGRLVLALSKSF